MNRRSFLRTSGSLLLASLVLNQRDSAIAVSNSDLPNVLFITIDDLRPDFGCYGHPFAVTPCIDRLASNSTVFTKAYCQFALCGPTRASVLTGLTPDSTGIYDLVTRVDEALPDVQTLPQFFKSLGYHTANVGRAFHNQADHKEVWDYHKLYTKPLWVDDENLHTISECAEVADDAYSDGKIAKAAITYLKQTQETPFFMALGLAKPHAPFCAPKKYWDMYDRDTLPLPARQCPDCSSKYGLDYWGELRGYHDIPSEGPLSDAQSLEVIHGYYAALSYMDALVGSVLSELDNLGIRDNTIIVFWGDHGYKLGEYGDWAKRTIWEPELRIPLIISVPGGSHSMCHSLVAALDIYPTLADLVHKQIPPHCEGISLVPLLEDPSIKLRNAVRSQVYMAASKHTDNTDIMGYSIRTEKWRYNEWRDLENDTLIDSELYDYRDTMIADSNLATNPEYEALVDCLHHSLHSPLFADIHERTGWLPQILGRKPCDY